MKRQPRRVSKQARRLFHKQGGRCHYCWHQMSLRRGTSDMVTVDHKFPKSRGGTKHASNTVGACLACNNAKGDMPYEDFLSSVKKNGRPDRRPTNHPEPKAPRQSKPTVTGPWKRDRLKTRPYLADVGKHNTLAAALVAAGIVKKESSR